jgi:hypothetical protein
MLFLFVIITFGIYYNVTYFLTKEVHSDHYHDHSHEVDMAVERTFHNENLTWEGLIQDCGASVIVENSARANEIFARKYFKQVVQWKGYFLSAFIQTVGPYQVDPDHLLNLNIRMIPSESLKNPDLFLSLDARKYQQFESVIHSIKSGDAIRFKASFENLGNEWRTHHLHLIDIEKTTDFIPSDQKLVLFQGINFNITGHLQNKEDIIQMVARNKTQATQEAGNSTLNN